MFTDFNLSTEPAWPWSTIGLCALALAALTVWTYLGVQHAWRRIAIVLAFRLAALVLIFLMLLRPSFAMTYLEGVEPAKWLVVLDASDSMNIADVDGKPTRWQQMNKLWESPEVKRRVERLASEQQIEVVKYHADAELRPYDAGANPIGKRTDMAAWLHELWLKHAHEKNVRGIAIFSDGADNGKASPVEKALKWRGVAPIHTFGLGDPSNAKFKKDIGLTSILIADAKPISVKSGFPIRATAQAPGFAGEEVEIGVTMEDVNNRTTKHTAVAKVKYPIAKEKDLAIDLRGEAPDKAGEYQLTLKIAKHRDEVNEENNTISTFVEVMKEKLNILWVDRPRVHEPTFAIRALTRSSQGERPISVWHFTPPATPGKKKPTELYEFDLRRYDVIIIGDIGVQQFCQGELAFLDEIGRRVRDNQVGLLMLGGSETFAKGGWHEQKAIMDLLPVTLDPGQPAFRVQPVRALPAKGATKFDFLDLLPDPKANGKLWNEDFETLDGFMPLGTLANKGTTLLERDKDTPLLAVTKVGEGRTAVFAVDSTSRAWIQRTADAEGNLTRDTSASYQRFWKQLVLWLAWQKDQGDALWIKLDQRRINVDNDEKLGFTFGLRNKDGSVSQNAQFEARVVGPKGEQALRFNPEQQHQRGSFTPKEPGEYQLVIKGKAGDVIGEQTQRFLVTSMDIEKAHPLAEHDKLRQIAEAADGRLHPATEAALLQLLDELRTQAAGEGRVRTTHWPDWKRLPATDLARDQLPGMWHSFSLVGFLLFVTLLACEWLLRRRWDLA